MHNDDLNPKDFEGKTIQSVDFDAIDIIHFTFTVPEQRSKLRHTHLDSTECLSACEVKVS